MLAELLDDILAQKRLTPYFQPIVDLAEGTIHGFEALIRGPSASPLHSPVALYEIAERHGRLVDLDLLCREIHIRSFAQLQLPGRLFLNVNPATLLQPGFPPGFTKRFLRQQGLSPDRVVVEITEQTPIDNYDLIRQALAHYRDMGFSVAIDDLGAGYAGLRTWSELRPDFVKLDRHFIQGIHEDSAKRQFVYSIQEIAASMGCTAIAEGIETPEELQVVQSLGVRLGQGYHFGRPSPAPCTELPAIRSGGRQGHGYGGGHRGKTLAALVRTVPIVAPHTTVEEVGELFTAQPRLMSIPVVAEGQPLGMVRRFDFMNLYASRYGRDLYGRKPILHCMDSGPLIVEQSMSLEKASRLITDQEQIHRGDDFIITEEGSYLGIGTLIDLLRKITELQIRYARYANPLTLLPGNVPINEHLERLLREQVPFTACYCDLDRFKPFNDHFGYGRGDLVIRSLAGIFTECAGGEEDFVGHIGGDDFMIILQKEDWQAVCGRILARFDSQVPGFYDAAERRAGGLWAEDRAGRRTFHPLLTLSIGAVRPALDRGYTCHDIATMATEAKRMAKRQEGSALFVERRGCLPDAEEGRRG